MDQFSLDTSMTVYRDHEQMLVICEGGFNLNNREQVQLRIETLMNGFGGTLYLHIGGLRELDSAGLGVLVGLNMVSHKHKIEFCLLAPSAVHLKLLEVTRLVTIIKVLSGMEAETLRLGLEKPEHLVEHPWPGRE